MKELTLPVVSVWGMNLWVVWSHTRACPACAWPPRSGSIPAALPVGSLATAMVPDPILAASSEGMSSAERALPPVTSPLAS